MKFFPSFNHDFDLFDDFFRPTFPEMRHNLMKTDISEKDGQYELNMELPGYQKEDVKLSLKDGYLLVEAEHKDDKEEKDKKGKVIRQERYFGSCSRSFYVGASVKEEDIKASFVNGELHISVPKAKEELPETKYIAIE